jgi:hypothetical protein
VTAGVAGDDTESAPSRRPALAAHVERVIARLANARGAAAQSPSVQQHLDQSIRELEQIAGPAVRARGEARAVLVTQLSAMDDALMAAAIGRLDRAQAERLRAEATEELAAFGNRMPPEARARAIESAFVRLVREGAGLPVVRYE